jgi:WD domain, G-beta repeat
MLLTKLKITTAPILILTVFCSGAALIGHNAWAARQKESAKPSALNRSTLLQPDNKDAADAGKEIIAGTPLRSGPPLAQVEHKSNVLCVAWAPNGKWLITGSSDGTITIIDAASSKGTRSFAGGGAVSAMALSHDGKKVVLGRLLTIWDVENGKRLQAFGGGGAVAANAGSEQLTFSPDSQGVIAVGIGQLNWWGLSGSGGGIAMGRAGGGGCAAVAPDGLAVGWSEGQGLVRWCKTDQFGGPVNKFGPNTFQSLQVGNCTCMAFGPGATLLAIGGQGNDVQLWDLKDNKKTAVLTGLQKPAAQLVFSADGKVLAALAEDGAAIRVWDLNRNTTRCQINHNRGAVGALAISPDGKMLATTLKDGKLLFLWKANARELTHKGPPLDLPAKELAGLWTDLINSDFEKADAAYRMLGAAGDNAIAFLGKQIRAIAVPDADIKQIEKLVAELDSDKFVARENAVKELTAVGELAIVPLQRLLDNAPSVEAKQRASLILKKIGEPVLTPDRLRVLDAIDLLEQVHSAKAVSLLQEIERDALIPQIRREAQEALRRLARFQQEKK